MDVRIAGTDAEIMACYPVMQALRPHLREDEFLARVRRQQEAGYRLACLHTAEALCAVAGFRISENLAWGRFLYVDDLVVAPAWRSRGCGAWLLGWLRDHARGEGCGALHLDSGLQRKAAHRFYQREGMTMTSGHFAVELAGTGAPRHPPAS